VGGSEREGHLPPSYLDPRPSTGVCVGEGLWCSQASSSMAVIERRVGYTLLDAMNSSAAWFGEVINPCSGLSSGKWGRQSYLPHGTAMCMEWVDIHKYTSALRHRDRQVSCPYPLTCKPHASCIFSLARGRCSVCMCCNNYSVDSSQWPQEVSTIHATRNCGNRGIERAHESLKATSPGSVKVGLLSRLAGLPSCAVIPSCVNQRRQLRCSLVSSWLIPSGALSFRIYPWGMLSLGLRLGKQALCSLLRKLSHSSLYLLDAVPSVQVQG
jgi:hypothetical protein